MYSKAQQQALQNLSDELLGQKISVPSDQGEASNLAQKIRDVIRYHDWRYYVLTEPVITDYEYDRLFKALKELEEKFPVLVVEDSPTQRVPQGLTKEFPEVSHWVPMLSLDNSYNEDDLREWAKRVKNITGRDDVAYSVEPKFDGSSITLIYENDKLVRGATRGDGTVGEDITPNVRVLRSLPLSAPFSEYGISRVELRGEVLINKELFRQINEQRQEEGLAILANPRNTASGALRLQDAREVQRRGLEAFIYQIGYAVDSNGNTVLGNKIQGHNESVDLLFQLGFKTPAQQTEVYKDIDAVIEYCQEWQEKRDDYPYEIDGMVVKVNNLHLQEECGATSHHPRWAIAYKFKARQGITTLEQVEFNVGRVGTVTPVAKVKPVSVGGVTISSISLFNEDVVKEKDLQIGDQVIVERAGDVIPYIVRPLKDKRPANAQPIVYPENCPSCGSRLVRPEGEALIRCMNINCPAQVVERLIHFVSKGAMDIQGLGDKLIRKFYDLGYLEDIADIYQLPYDKILELEGFKKKSVDNLKNAIEESKAQPIYRVIFGLGIRYVGLTTAKMLARQVNDIRDFQNWSIEDLEELEDVGPRVSGSIYDFFHLDRNLQLIEKMEKLGVPVKQEEAKSETVSNKLEGKTFLFTGSLQKMTRSDAQEMVENNGGKLISSVSKNLNYLVVGESPGSKLEKARGIDSIEILEEDEFLKMVNGE